MGVVWLGESDIEEAGVCVEHVDSFTPTHTNFVFISSAEEDTSTKDEDFNQLTLEKMNVTTGFVLSASAGSRRLCFPSSRRLVVGTVRHFGRLESTSRRSPQTATAEGDFVKPWKDAASLILAAPSAEDPKGPLQFLIMKRSKANMFLPNSLCFPGGQVSPVDFDMDWINLYAVLGAADVRQSFFLGESALLPLLYGFREPEKDPREVLRHVYDLMPLEVSFRLAAIRETFEEVGILLAKKVDKSALGERGFGREARGGLGKTASFLKIEDPDEMEEWQRVVREEPKGLLKMCRHFGVLPDLNALVEWNNWLTPNSLKPKRFDTIFYMATVPFPLPFLIDGIEVASARWSKAEAVLSAAAAGKTRLIPPQIYELTRLQNTPLEKLQRLMRMRLSIGLERWCPCYLKAKDGIISVLPGDDLYPLDYKIETFEDVRESGSTIDELRKSTSSHHRIEFRSEFDFKLVANVSPKHGQVYFS